MTTEIDQHDRRHQRLVLAALAACCVGPMLAIVALTALAGIAIGTAAAITTGAVAALGCTVVMISRHRAHDHTDAHAGSAS